MTRRTTNGPTVPPLSSISHYFTQSNELEGAHPWFISVGSYAGNARILFASSAPSVLFLCVLRVDFPSLLPYFTTYLFLFSSSPHRVYIASIDSCAASSSSDNSRNLTGSLITDGSSNSSCLPCNSFSASAIRSSIVSSSRVSL